MASQLDANKVATFDGSISVQDLTERVVSELGDRAGDHTLVLDVPSSLPTVESDEGKIHQILTNFIVNACKYTPTGSKVTVRGREEDGGITIAVVDQGEGIPSEMHEKVFDRFFQVDQSSTRAVGGTGLGLYICKGLAEAIGGRVWLERSDETGSTFCLWLPNREPAASTEPIPQPRAVSFR